MMKVPGVPVLCGATLMLVAASGTAQNGLWTNLPSAIGPSFRATHGLATESFTGLTVLFGGQGGTTLFAETWVFDGCTWSLAAPSISPPGRVNTFLARSPVPGRLVLFGGVETSGFVGTSTWEFDVTTFSWYDVTPAGPNPPGRQVHAMAYDSVRGRTVVFGGADSNYANFGDTWEWDGAAWTNVTPTAGPSPSARGWPSMAFDAARGRTVLFGGYNGSQLGDTWEWDGVQWTPVVTPSAPAPRSSGAIAYDPWSQRIVLFAGSQSWPIGLNDTWEYDGVNWYPITIAGTSPPAQYLHRMASDPARGGILLFGAYGNNWTNLSETWRYQRASLTASTLAPVQGTTVALSLSFPTDAGFPFLAGISLSGSCPGLPIPGGRFLPLNFDVVTSLSISGLYPQIFQGFAGTLNASGLAAPALAVPVLPGLSGAVISVAAATAAGPTIGSITNALSLVVQ